MSIKKKEAEKVAKLFHRHYEFLAPKYGYKTRKKSAVPWSRVPKNNKELMIHTVQNVLVEVMCSDDKDVMSLVKKLVS